MTTQPPPGVCTMEVLGSNVCHVCKRVARMPGCVLGGEGGGV